VPPYLQLDVHVVAQDQLIMHTSCFTIAISLQKNITDKMPKQHHLIMYANNIIALCIDVVSTPFDDVHMVWHVLQCVAV